MAQVQALLRAADPVMELGLRFGGHKAVDDFWEHTLNIWDTAASMVILQEAGGTLTDWSGGLPGMEKSSIAASNGHIHQKILSLVGK